MVTIVSAAIGISYMYINIGGYMYLNVDTVGIIRHFILAHCLNKIFANTYHT